MCDVYSSFDFDKFILPVEAGMFRQVHLMALQPVSRNRLVLSHANHPRTLFDRCPSRSDLSVFVKEETNSASKTKQNKTILELSLITSIAR